jgi:excisionase family DNA binding protein
MIAKEIRFCRDKAERLRELTRLTDEMRRRLTDLAAECDYRAREIENLADEPKTENRPPRLPQPGRTIEPLTLSIKDTSQLLGLGRTTIYRLIADRQLETVKVGNRTLIKTASIRSLVELQSD